MKRTSLHWRDETLKRPLVHICYHNAQCLFTVTKPLTDMSQYGDTVIGKVKIIIIIIIINPVRAMKEQSLYLVFL